MEGKILNKVCAGFKIKLKGKTIPSSIESQLSVNEVDHEAIKTVYSGKIYWDSHVDWMKEATPSRSVKNE